MSNPELQKAAAEALALLKPHVADVPQPLLAQISSLAGNASPSDEEDVDEGKVAKALLEINNLEDRIAKEEGGSSSLRDSVAKARIALELEHLHAVSPSAARKYEKEREPR